MIRIYQHDIVRAQFILSSVLDFFGANDTGFSSIKPLIIVQTYSNFREQGYCLFLSHTVNNAPKYKISFSTQRNFDCIVVYFGEFDDFDTAGNIPNEDRYKKQEIFYTEQDASDHIIHLITEAYEYACNKSKENPSKQGQRRGLSFLQKGDGPYKQKGIMNTKELVNLLRNKGLLRAYSDAEIDMMVKEGLTKELRPEEDKNVVDEIISIIDSQDNWTNAMLKNLKDPKEPR